MLDISPIQVDTAPILVVVFCALFRLYYTTSYIRAGFSGYNTLRGYEHSRDRSGMNTIKGVGCSKCGTLADANRRLFG